MKKRIAILLVLCIVFSMIPITASAAEVIAGGTCGDDLTWVLTEDGTLTISGTGDMDYIGWDGMRDTIRSVVMEEGATSIGYNAFDECRNLTSVIIPDTVTKIEYDAFRGCSKLKEVTIPNGVKTLGNAVFRECGGLTEISLPENMTTFGEDAFRDCISLKSVVIPEGITTISSSAFSGCANLTSIVLPQSLTSIGEFAFYKCIRLREITIPRNVTVIEDDAFHNCSALSAITLPNDLMVLGEAAFFGCSALEKITIPKSVNTVAYTAFARCTSLTEVVLSGGITAVGEYAFTDCENLSKLTLPKTLTAIGEGAFHGCTSLKDVTIPAGVTVIEDYAFACGGVGRITFLGDAPAISPKAFINSAFTALYPAGNPTWTADVMQDYGGDLTWGPYGGAEKEYTITWKEAYSSLGGNIAVVFKADLSEDLVEDPNAFMRFTYAGKTVDVPVSEASRAGDYYNFFCRITSVNMTDDITAQMMVGEEAIGRNVTTSLEKYCSYIISNSKDAKTVNLMKAMLNYGAAAQKMMNYKTDNLANKSLSDADKVLTKVDATQYKHSITGTEDGIKPVEALLVLGSETTIRVGFSLTGNKTIDQYTFTVDGVEVEPVLKGGKYVLEVPNIAAHRLDEYHTFTCGGITIHYCGLSYVNQVMGYYTEGTTFDMAAALYNYSQATEAYTEAVIA